MIDNSKEYIHRQFLRKKNNNNMYHCKSYEIQRNTEKDKDDNIH